MCNIPIRRVRTEELHLLINRVFEWFVRIDILLTAIHDTNESQFQWVDAPGEDVERVRSCVHEVDLGENPDGATTLRVDLTREFE